MEVKLEMKMKSVVKSEVTEVKSKSGKGRR